MPRARACALLIAVLSTGCSKASPAGHLDFPDVETGVDGGGGVDARDGGADGARADAPADALADSGSPGPGDAKVDAFGEVAESGAVDGDGPDLGSPIDAPTSEGKPTDSTDGHVCDTELAWWAQNARFDASAGSPDFVAQVDALIGPGDHPITVVDHEDPGTLAWTLQTSATVLGGDLAQHFPATEAPSAPVSMMRTAAGFSAASPQASGWIHVVDAAAADVWIPIAEVSTAATYGDSACLSLTGATVEAIVPASAASVALSTKSGATTLGALLGAQTSTTPAGWKVSLSFDATRVSVSSK